MGISRSEFASVSLSKPETLQPSDGALWLMFSQQRCVVVSFISCIPTVRASFLPSHKTKACISKRLICCQVMHSMQHFTCQGSLD